MRWRRVAHRLPLTGVAVAGAVVGHMVAYVLAVPSPTVRVALLGATGHAYWNVAIAAAVVLGLASLATTLRRRFRAGLLSSGRPAGRAPGSRGRPAGRVPGRDLPGPGDAGAAGGRHPCAGPAGWSAAGDRRGRPERRSRWSWPWCWRRPVEWPRPPAGPCVRHHAGPSRPSLPVVDLVVGWPSRLLAAGLGSRAPPRSLVARIATPADRSASPTDEGSVGWCCRSGLPDGRQAGCGPPTPATASPTRSSHETTPAGRHGRRDPGRPADPPAGQPGLRA